MFQQQHQQRSRTNNSRQRIPPRRRKKKNKLNVLLLFTWLLSIIIYFALTKYHLNVAKNDDFESELLSKSQNDVSPNTLQDEFKSKDQTKNPKDPKDHPLPEWIMNYIKWHNSMREKYPGKSLLEDPNAPKVLVRVCLGLCGGLHDRLGQLPLDLYLANQTERILLIKWQKPQPLEEFLIPPSFGNDNHNDQITSIDWTFPRSVPGWGTLGDKCRTLNDCAKEVRNQPKIKGNVQNHQEFQKEDYAPMIEDNIKMLNEGELKDTKHVTFTILGTLSEDYLEQKLKDLGETDMIHNTPSFGNIFRAFFKPHPNVQKQINSISKKMGLIENQYTFAHCRVRHPKAYPKGEKFDGQFIANADKTGLPFKGRFLELAVGVASRSIQCAAKELPFAVDQHPLYFTSDSSDLVTYFAKKLKNSEYISKNSQWFQKPGGANRTALELVSKYNVVARDQSIVTAHIDKNKGRPAYAYYATFVDLFIGIQAKCVSFGIGNYAIFAARLSGTDCKVKYAREMWGEHSTDAKATVPMCKL